MPTQKDVPPAGEWSNVFMSGIVAGIATGIARAQMEAWIIVAGVMFAVCIANANFRFSWPQKLVALVLMMAITFHGHVLLEMYGEASKAN